VEEEGEHQHSDKEAHEHNAEGKAVKKEKVIAFKPIEVAIGTTDLGYTEISPLQSISEGAKIVTIGAFYLLSSSKGGGHHEH
jgi:membrane fusion protein, heavy metal efflux system